jgi:sugar O-acyltransferase (sialic acid O-acetyltransferase NeuD family)
MKVIIFGTNDIAQLARFYLENDSDLDPVAFCVDAQFRKQETLEGLPLLAWEECSPQRFDPGQYRFFAPLYDSRLREQKYQEIIGRGFSCVSYVSSRATCWSTVGENCFIMEDNTIQPFVNIGRNVVLWSGNHIGHHSTIKDNVFFSSHVVLSGHCTVESYSWFGVNSTIRDHVHIAEGTFVAMGSTIIKDTSPYKKYRGNPAQEYGDVEKTGGNI